jgi:hypothetical protein
MHKVKPTRVFGPHVFSKKSLYNYDIFIKMDRRKFTKLGLTSVAVTSIGSTNVKPVKDKKIKPALVHHVYFWLKNPDSQADKDALIKGLKSLIPVKSILTYHIGVPAGTSREVIDASYSISWLTTHKDKKAQDDYQVDPLHLKFVEENQHLWTKVVVYDSIAI